MCSVDTLYVLPRAIKKVKFPLTIVMINDDVFHCLLFLNTLCMLSQHTEQRAFSFKSLFTIVTFQRKTVEYQYNNELSSCALD